MMTSTISLRRFRAAIFAATATLGLITSSARAVVTTMAPVVRLGTEVLFDSPEHLKRLDGKRVGLVTNPTGVDSEFRSTIDRLKAYPNCQLTALFAPEHGLRGAEIAGENVKSGVDPITSVPIYSLHGTDPKTKKSLRKPMPQALATVDILLYDIQDIGNRSYTYVSTMRNCMEACGEEGKQFIVLDRPNAMGGDWTDGNVLDARLRSSVGWASVPYLYGMTPGEIAGWMNNNTPTTAPKRLEAARAAQSGTEVTSPTLCDLHVVKMTGWKRSMRWWDTGLPWIPPSTHLPRPETCWYIAATGLIGELHTLNEGVGYPGPFEYLAAPFINANAFADEMNRRALPGFHFRPVQYKPFYGRYKEQMCGGVHIMITDYARARPLEAAVHLLDAANRMYPKANVLALEPKPKATSRRKAKSKAKAKPGRGVTFDKVAGSYTLRDQIFAGRPATEILQEWAAEREKWSATAKKYWLYE